MNLKELSLGPIRAWLERCDAIRRYGYRHKEIFQEWPDDGTGRPRILFLVDRPGWAYDNDAQSVKRLLSDRFDIHIAYAAFRPHLRGISFDLVYVFSRDEYFHTRFVQDPRRIIKEIAHVELPDDQMNNAETVFSYVKSVAWDAGTLTVLSRKLQQQLAPYCDTFLASQGVDHTVMVNRNNRNGKLKFGWVGRRTPRKGVDDILLPAAREFEFHTAEGHLSLDELVDFYNEMDVICIASTVEGGPLTLLEGMCTGCFPVATDVGVVPEVVTHGVNGLIVERTVPAFREAFQWCVEHPDRVREVGRRNSQVIARTRSWQNTITAWEAVFDHALEKLPKADRSASV